MKRLIGIAGNKGAGKDTTADILVAELGYTQCSFAGVLKEMLMILLQDIGVKEELIERMVNGDMKEVPCPELCGKSARYAMQTLGTEWGRHTIGEDIWIRSCLYFAKDYERVVIPDVRFANEVKAIRDAGGFVVRIKRHGFDGDAHVSEQQSFAADYAIRNSTRSELRARILQLERAFYEKSNNTLH